MASPLEMVFNKIVAATARRLLQFGFKKRGNAFRLLSGGNSALIEFQKSRDNTGSRLSFTINVAIVCGLLLDSERLTIEKSRAVDGHLRDRIGTFLPDRQDKWWDITGATDEEALSNEVSGIICDLAVPFLLRYVDNSELVALWESGRAPSLTEAARVRKLKTLKDIFEMNQA